MAYRLVCGVQSCVWRAGWCVAYRLVCGVQAGVWRTGLCVACRLVCGVHAVALLLITIKTGNVLLFLLRYKKRRQVFYVLVRICKLFQKS